jgi:NAD(P)-dependent dehydrogenase (short-subunit alcohol dehydrogenase family)
MGVAVVTGASAGIGRATALAFAADGWDVGLISRNEERLARLRAEIERLGRKALPLPLDVSAAAEVEAAATRIEETLGPIEVWVSNAMVSVFSPVHEMSAAEFRRVTEVTYLGAVYGVLAALRRMRPRDRGSIVIVGSALAYRGIPLQSAYCGAKHAIQGFTDSVRAELHHRQSAVRVCEVHLPALNTPQFRWVKSSLPMEARPVPPIYQPEVAADAIAWIIEHPRREMWVGSSTVAAIVANRLAPGVLDRYLGWTGYRAQLTEEPRDPDRPFHLYEPVPGDRGARGVFDQAANPRSLQLWASKHRWAVAGGLALACALGVGALRD